MSYQIRGDFLKDVREYFEQMPMIAEKSAMLALNQVAERQAVPMLRRDAESQVNFPKGYLDQDDRLGISDKARMGSLQVTITGRDVPTSLARFASNRLFPTPKGKGVTVTVKKGGKTKHMKDAFLIRLKNGNLGVATRDPSTASRAHKPKVLTEDKYGKIWLLYGPSVDQVLKAVAEDALPAIGEKVGQEFFRQFTRLSRG